MVAIVKKTQGNYAKIILNINNWHHFITWYLIFQNYNYFS